MTDQGHQHYDDYTPNERVQKRLNRINVDAEKISHREILAILENEEIWNEDRAVTKNEVKNIAAKIEKNHTARDPPGSRTIKDRLDELAETDLVIKNKLSSPHKYWKRKDEDVPPLYYWYIDESIRKADPYVEKITHPHTISSFALIMYIILTLRYFILSFDLLLILLLLGLYLLGHLASYLGEMEVD